MKTLIVLAMITFTAAAQAQQIEPRERSSGLHSSGYGAVTTNYSKFNGENAMFAGAYGGWFINHKFLIGLGGYALVSSHDGYSMENEPATNNKLKMGYGGLMLEYALFEKKRLHVTTNVLIGAGAVVNAYKTSYTDQYGDNWHSDEESGFRVIQPSINIEYSVTDWFHVAAGGGYRYITGANMSGISNKDMSAPTANLAFKFGVF